MVHPYHLGSPQSALASEAAWCAHDQGGHFEFQHILYENQGAIQINPDTMADLADEVGLDGEALRQCLADGTRRADLEQARQAALNRGVNSTPTFFINNQRVEGNVPYARFQTIIDQELRIAQ